MEVLKTFIAESPQPIFIVDSNTRQIHYTNKAASQSSAASLSGKIFEEIVGIIELPVSGKKYAQYNKIWYLVSSTYIGWKGNDYQVLELKPRQLVPGTQSLESWKNMIAVMLHRLRSPLTGITGYLDMMEEENKDPSLEKRFNSINKGFNYVYNLMDELEVLYNIPANFKEKEFTPLNLSNILDEVLLNFDKEQRKRIEISISQNLPPIKSAPDSLKKALQHLIKNALEHSDDQQIAVSILPEKGGSIIIKNGGGPIAQTIKSQIFYPFVTSKATNLGIGLTMALLYTYQFAGTIFFEEDNDSVQFTLKLPLFA